MTAPDLPRIDGVEPYAEGAGWRIWCGDSRELAPLMPPADLVLTSPPYLAQRTRDCASRAEWDALVPPVLVALPLAPTGQMLVNLGLVRRVPLPRYWDSMIDALEAAGRPLVDWYVWDRGYPKQGEFLYRLWPQHDWLFHYRAGPRHPLRTVATKWAGACRTHHTRKPDGTMRRRHLTGVPVADTRCQASVVTAPPCHSSTERTGHHAQMSLAAARMMVAPWAYPGSHVVDPFSGVATTGVAALEAGLTYDGIEIDPHWCEVAAARLRAAEAAGGEV